MRIIKPLRCLENINPGIEMPVFQNSGIRAMLENKQMLLAFDTGTGKTFTYSGFIRALLNRNPEFKHVFVIINDSLNQAYVDVSSIVAAKVVTCDGTAEGYQRLKRFWKESSVAILTYEAFRVHNVVRLIYNHLTEIESFVVDEAHHVSNWHTSNTAFMIRALCKHIPYKGALSATPITTVAKQYYRLMNTIDRSLSPNRDETFWNKYEERYFPVNRADYQMKGNYKSSLEIVAPMIHQLAKPKGIVFKTMKGTGAENQVVRLLDLVQERLLKGLKVIVYVAYHDTRRWVEKHLEAVGIEYSSLHGKVTKRSDRQDSLDTFNSGKTKVLITSVAESLNIEADSVIFYEFTTKVKQVMGRAHRGMEEKELDIVFILTRDTVEVDYFVKYIYRRSITVQQLLGKDYSEIIKIGQQIKEMELAP